VSGHCIACPAQTLPGEMQGEAPLSSFMKLSFLLR
jgi:hypothetical protein